MGRTRTEATGRPKCRPKREPGAISRNAWESLFFEVKQNLRATGHQQPDNPATRQPRIKWKPFWRAPHLTRVPPKDPKTLWRDVTYSRSVGHEVFEGPNKLVGLPHAPRTKSGESCEASTPVVPRPRRL